MSAVDFSHGLRREYGIDISDDEGPPAPPLPPKPPPPGWMKQIEGIANRRLMAARTNETWPARREILYAIEISASVAADCVVMRLLSHDRKQDGTWTAAAILSLKRAQIAELPDDADREIVAALAGSVEHYGWGGGYTTGQVPSLCEVRQPLSGRIVPLAVRTGRCYLRSAGTSADIGPLEWDDGGAWRFELKMQPRKRTGWQVTGVLRRGDQSMSLAEADLVTEGFVFAHDRVAPLAAGPSFEWIRQFRTSGPLEAPEKDGEALLAALLCAPGAPPVQAPEELPYEQVPVAPRPGLRISGRRSRRRATPGCAVN